MTTTRPLTPPERAYDFMVRQPELYRCLSEIAERLRKEEQTPAIKEVLRQFDNMLSGETLYGPVDMSWARDR